MPTHTNLYRRKGGSYYFMRRIPTKLLPAYVRGKQLRLIKISLKTSDPAEARRLVRVRSAEVQAEFDEIERRMCPAPIRNTATEAELIAIACRWLHAEERHAAGNMAWMTDLDRDEVERLIGESMECEGAFQGEAGEDDVARLACALRERHRLNLSGAEWSAMFELIRRAMVEHEKRQRERLSGGRMVGVSFDPVFTSVGALNPPPAPAKPLTFDKMLEGWKAERKPPERSYLEFQRALRSLAAHAGHDDPRRVTKTVIAGWKTTLIGDGKAEKTVAKNIAMAKAIYAVALRNDLVATNPVAAVTMPPRKNVNGGARARLPFDDAEAKLMLAAARDRIGYRRWLPWLLAYTGARLEEVAQALIRNVRQEDGVWVLDICAGDGKALKNAGSARLVPLHPALIAEGFLAYVDAQRKAGETALFSDAAPDRFGRRGGVATKVLGRWMRGLGIADQRKVAGHSWRHRFKDLCRRVGIAKDIHDALTGHAAGDTGSGYGLGFPVSVLADAIAKLPNQCPASDAGGRLLDLG